MANCRFCATDCPEQGEHDRLFDCALYTERKPTNADRLRAKLQDDMELAKSRIQRDGGLCTALDVTGYIYADMLDAVQDELDWLRQPAEE